MSTKKVLKNKKSMDELLEKTESKLQDKETKKTLKTVWKDLLTIIRLLKAWVKRDYKDISWKSLIIATSSLIYLVCPIDAIPDFLPAGLLDDLGILTMALKQIYFELEKFREWEDLNS